MKLDSEGKFDIDKRLKDYLPELDSTNKGNLVIKDILAHQSGLQAFIPYWSKTVENGNAMPHYYSDKKSEEYPLTIANGLYAKILIKDSIYKWTNESSLANKNKDGKYPFKYSDVGYYYMLKIIEKLSSQPIDQFLQTKVYNQMNLQNLSYLPLTNAELVNIAPTEKDTYFRNQLIQGYVHDQGAAMMGGVAGHAGLFSNAFDVAQVLQMTLNQGNYNTHEIIDGKIILDYTSKQLEGDNRKGATWDRMRPDGKGASSDYVSESSYGHTGFTGTMVWVDPDYDLVYVFLSNRVNPDASNNDLLKYDVRTKIQDLIYESMLNYNAENPLYKLSGK
jgi:CubicO group peptidase (beta-lactamase class C family)